MKKNIGIILIVFVIIFCGGFSFYNLKTLNSNKQVQQNLEKAKRTLEAIPVWHKKIQTKQELKFGIINDTHVHPVRINREDKSKNSKRKLKEKDVAPIRNFVSQMNKFEPTMVVHLGDVIEGTGDKDYVGVIGIKLVKEELNKINVPIYWVLGNHDLRSVTKEQFKEVLQLDSLFETFDIGDYRFIIMDGNFNPEGGFPSPKGNKFIPGYVPKDEIKWLKKQLETDKRVFVFLHQGVYTHKLKGDFKKNDNNLSEEKYKMKQPIVNSKELRDIFKEYRVDGFFNGHMEARYYEKSDFTNYYSFTGTKKSEDYPDSFYEVDIKNGVPDVTMYYIPPNSTQIKKVDFEQIDKN